MLTHGGTNFGGQHNSIPVASSFDPTPNNLLADAARVAVARPTRVTIGGVNEIPAQFQVTVHDLERGSFVAAPTELHRAEGDGGDVQTTFAEPFVSHGMQLNSSSAVKVKQA
jgi:hypothetical protein